jgi:hypothetical protein
MKVLNRVAHGATLCEDVDKKSVLAWCDLIGGDASPHRSKRHSPPVGAAPLPRQAGAGPAAAGCPRHTKPRSRRSSCRPGQVRGCGRMRSSRAFRFGSLSGPPDPCVGCRSDRRLLRRRPSPGCERPRGRSRDCGAGARTVGAVGVLVVRVAARGRSLVADRRARDPHSRCPGAGAAGGAPSPMALGQQARPRASGDFRVLPGARGSTAAGRSTTASV